MCSHSLTPRCLGHSVFSARFCSFYCPCIQDWLARLLLDAHVTTAAGSSAAGSSGSGSDRAVYNRIDVRTNLRYASPSPDLVPASGMLMFFISFAFV